jgi:hypothetical protein
MRKVHEDRTASSVNAGARIVINCKNKIIYMIYAPKIFMPGGEWLYNKAIILTVANMITPAKVRAKCFGGS